MAHRGVVTSADPEGREVPDIRDSVTLDDLRAELDRKVRVPGLNNTRTMPIKTRMGMLAPASRRRWA